MGSTAMDPIDIKYALEKNGSSQAAERFPHYGEPCHPLRGCFGTDPPGDCPGYRKTRDRCLARNRTQQTGTVENPSAILA